MADPSRSLSRSKITDSPPTKTNKGTLALLQRQQQLPGDTWRLLSFSFCALVVTCGDDGQMMKGSIRQGLLTSR